MATTTDDTTPTPDGGGDGTTVERLEQVLESWRARIDELLVQADLASKDVGERARTQATVAQNAYLAATNRLKQLPKDAGANLGSIRDGIDKLLEDIKEAYESAEAVIRRGRGD